MAKKKSSFSLREEYSRSLSFIRESKNFIYIAILLFLIFAVIAFFFKDMVNSFFISTLNVNLNENILTFVENLVRRTEGMSLSQLIGFIFVNNIQSSFLGMILGIIFCIFPFMAVVTNGYLLGFVAKISVETEGIFVLWRILPHGIFELPAVLISLGLGFRLGSVLFRGNSSLKHDLINSFRVFLLIISPLLIIAAIIEGFLMIFLS
jgi:stage II sporulation protein M